ncbi:MAG TPA: hypothetical protein VNO32_47950, partial [Candidatus Acidoferrum sp.]|nr:hypothetical protein [Candidatus Acidoferrum sp.]
MLGQWVKVNVKEFACARLALDEHKLGRREDDFGVEEGAGDAGGDGDEVALAGEYFDLAGAGEVGEIDGASAADAGGGGFVGGDGGELGQKFAGVDEEGFDGAIDSRFLHSASLSLRESEAAVGMTISFLSVNCFNQIKFSQSDFSRTVFMALDFFDGVCLGYIEFRNRGAAQGFEMGSAAKGLAHFVGDGAHVGAGGDAG